MSRMSARFIAPRFGQTASGIYKIWEEMGLVTKDKFGDWVLTNLGREIGGRMSSGNHLSVPTFDFDTIAKMTREFLDSKK